MGEETTEKITCQGLPLKIEHNLMELSLAEIIALDSLIEDELDRRDKEPIQYDGGVTKLFRDLKRRLGEWHI